MSTSTLLIVSASLRFHWRSGRFERPSPSEVLTGRGWTSTPSIQNSAVVDGGALSRSPKDRQRPLAAAEAGAVRVRQHPSRPAGAALASGQRLLTLFTILRSGARQFLRRMEAASPSVSPLYGRVSLACLTLFLTCTASAALAQEASPAAQTRNPDLVLPPVTVEAEPVVPEPTTAQSGRIGGPAPGPCVTVDIAGHRAGHLECATDRLQAAADTAQAQTRSAIDTPVIGAGSPDVQTGVANQTATRQRMGNTFGTSVHPQRPNRPVLPPRGGTPQ